MTNSPQERKITFRGRQFAVSPSIFYHSDPRPGHPVRRDEVVYAQSAIFACQLDEQNPDAPKHLTQIILDIGPAVWACPFCGGVLVLDNVATGQYPEPIFIWEPGNSLTHSSVNLTLCGYRKKFALETGLLKLALNATGLDYPFALEPMSPDLFDPSRRNDDLRNGKIFAPPISIAEPEFWARFAGQITERTADVAKVFRQRAGAAMQHNDYTRAITDFTAVLSIEDTADDHYRRALARFHSKDLASALVDLDDALHLDSYHLGGLHLRGTTHLELKHVEAAERDFSRWAELDPSNPEAIYWRGRARAAQGRLLEAISDYNNAQALGGPNQQVWEARAEAYARTGDVAAAQKDRDQLATSLLPITTVAELDAFINGIGQFRLRPMSAEMYALNQAYITAGTAGMQDGRWDEAIRGLELIIGRWPTFAAARINYVHCLIGAGRLQDALIAVEIAHRYAPHDPDVHLTTAKIDGALGNMVGQKQELQAALRDDPENFPALFAMGSVCAKDNDFRNAKSYLQRALNQLDQFSAETHTQEQIRGSKLDVLFALAQVFEAIGDSQQALNKLREFDAIEHDPRVQQSIRELERVLGLRSA